MRRLIVFSDPGGAKPCLSLAKKWQESDELLVCSDRQYAFYETFGVPVRNCLGKGAPEIFDAFCPDFLYVGTSYTSRIEMDFIREAVKRGIASACFVDHYTGFDVRFGTGENRTLPDEIQVIDNMALMLAQEAGLPVDRVRVTGNPYWDFLCKWKTRFTEQEVFQQLNIPRTDAKTILFAPDPLSNAGGAEKFGIDEVDILKILLKSAGEIAEPLQLLLKAHPNQSIDYLKTGLLNVPDNVDLHLVTPERDSILNDLIRHVDIVVGMFSNILLEAELLGTSAIYIICGIHVPLNLPHQARLIVSNRNELTGALTNILQVRRSII